MSVNSGTLLAFCLNRDTSGTRPKNPGQLVTTCMYVIAASHVHEQYRECGNLQPVILEVKVVMNEM